MSRRHFTVVPGFACSDSRLWQKKNKKKTGWGDLELNVFSTLFKKKWEKNVTSRVYASSENPGEARRVAAYLNEHWPT